MNLNFQRTVDRVAGKLICRLLSWIYCLRRKPTPPVEFQKVLIILLSEMGSLVLAYPMFRAIKAKHPDSSIYVLLFEKNREVLELLDVMPKENILTLNDASMKTFARDSVRVLRIVRSTGFDAVIDCELFARVSSIFSFFAGAPVHVGFHPYTQEGLYRGSFINRPVMYNPYHSITQQFLTMVEALDSDTVPTAKRVVVPKTIAAPSIAFEEEEIREMAERLYGDFPGIEKKTLVLIYPSGGILPIRAWPMDNYSTLTKALLGDGHAVAVIGLETDKGLAEQIASDCSSADCIDLTGYTRSVRELLILFHLASLLITNDGGPGQFAAMTPIPSIIFYGPETPALYGALSSKAYFFYLSLSCSPCLTAFNHRNSPCDGDNQCLKRIGPEQVYTKAKEMLANDFT
jgi:ADP-heptose:LPS heptosyltransferase